MASSDENGLHINSERSMMMLQAKENGVNSVDSYPQSSHTSLKTNSDTNETDSMCRNSEANCTTQLHSKINTELPNKELECQLDTENFKDTTGNENCSVKSVKCNADTNQPDTENGQSMSVIFNLTSNNGDDCGMKNNAVKNNVSTHCNGTTQASSLVTIAHINTNVCTNEIRHKLKERLHDPTRRLPSNMDSKSDNFRPLGRLLHDIGLELVREQVYRDLIEIQAAKNASNRLEEKEKSQLMKLAEAHARLVSRNSPYQLPVINCNRCNYASSSTNEMVLHHQYGSFSRTDPEAHICCACARGRGFGTRSATKFIAHLSEEHNITGRLLKKTANFACTNCPYEHRNSIKLQIHMSKCLKKYPLICNLQPMPGDCDIAVVYRTGDQGRRSMQQTNRPWSGSGSASATGPPSVRTLLNSLRSQQSAIATSPSSASGLAPAPAVNTSLSSSLICEICGKVVDGRHALWSHFSLAHHVQLGCNTMKEQDPWMKCDVCNMRFWTYSGLSRHLLLVHNRAIAGAYNTSTPVLASKSPLPAVGRCYLCGGSQTANPLSHFSTYHNITLLEMYHAKLCCLCNRKLISGRAFEEHMVEQHSDIFANYDVLRTVFHALTTARYYKSDDSRQTSQLLNDAQPSAPIKHISAIVVSPSSTKKPVKRKKEAVRKSEPSVTPIKTPEKPATVEEVKKLYENLADIGRPILRSMRHKLSADTSASNDASRISVTDGTLAESEQLISDDVPEKKVCLVETNVITTLSE